jgi:hypothetical protein
VRSPYIPIALGWNLSPHFGHSIRSKSTRLTRSGVIVNPHLEHVWSSDASTFSRLIFRDRGISGAANSSRLDAGHFRGIIRGAMQYIAFFADVQTVQAGKLRDALTKASNAGEDIYLIISSGGGNVFEGLSLGAFMKTLPVKITTHNVGQVDSIANLIFSAGSKRRKLVRTPVNVH